MNVAPFPFALFPSASNIRITFVSDVIDADALFADVLLAAPTARLPLDFTTYSGTWGGVVWRIGHRAMQLHLSGATELDAEAAQAWGIVDAVTDDPGAWLGARSAVALDTAASLVALRGGDPLERAAFAWLFATGEPQEGLRAFLDKRRPELRIVVPTSRVPILS